MELLDELLSSKQQYINYFFENVSRCELESVVSALLNCRGTVIFTGVGKSGLVAKKIALTFTSTGTCSLFLSPLDALHGDIGVVRPDDVAVLLSKSGETEELLRLLPYLRNRGVQSIAMVSKTTARLAAAADLSLHLPMERELCPFDMAPTTSTAVQLIAGDVIAIALMRLKKVSLDQYAASHPSGAIGQKIALMAPAKSLMLTSERLPVCFLGRPLSEVLVEMGEKRCGCILVVDPSNHLKGIFTDGDLRRSLEKEGGVVLQQPIEQLMTPNPRTVGPDEPLHRALSIMEGNQRAEVTVLPVVGERQELLGLIKLHDLVQSGLAG